MSKWLLIENRGELDKEALTLMGASTKRSEDGKIGMFGTGAKYAIAALLREGVDVEIYSGLKRFRFRTEEVTLRGQVFHQIHLLEGRERGGTPLNFTTEMGGLNWTVEQGLRELVSNALDEPGHDVRPASAIDPVEGRTKVYIGWAPQVREFWGDFDSMFLLRREPLEKGEGWAIYERSDPMRARVYRKGVRVYESAEYYAAFDYAVDDLTVDEERKADYYSVQSRVMKLANNLSVGSKRKVLKAAMDSKSLESQLTYQAQWYLRGDGWTEALGDCVLATPMLSLMLQEELASFDTMVLPEGWIAGLTSQGARQAKDVVSASRIMGMKPVLFPELGLVERERYNWALMFLRRVGVQIPAEKVEFFEPISKEAKGILGAFLPKEDKILISMQALESREKIVSTLFEEAMHRRSGQADKTRAFQDALIGDWLRLAQAVSGEQV